MMRIFLLLIISVVSFSSCLEKKKDNSKLLANELKELESFNEEEYKYIVTEVEVAGVKVGDKLKTHRSKLKKTDKKLDSVELFTLENNNETVGVVHVHEDNIHLIEVTSTKYKTPKGIKVGSTFKEAKEQYPDSETHGHIEHGKTVLMAGDYHFVLEDVSIKSYKIDEDKINPSTKIKKIVIRK